ncbi:MAG: hypothetical protein ACTSRP_23650 [Candidatus Helarchaeota archaeon]
MTIVQVNKYVINYNTRTKHAAIKIYYNLHETSCSEIINIDKDDLDMVINMLRFEKPIFWSTESKTLMTGPEEVGEEES